MDGRYFLVFEQGPRAGERYMLSASGLTIGRNPSNDIVLNDPKVSNQHCQISLQPDMTVILRDLQSTNGTIHQGKKISAVALQHEDRFTVGETLLRFWDTQEDSARAQVSQISPPPRKLHYRLAGGLAALLLIGGSLYGLLGADQASREYDLVPGNLLVDPSFESFRIGGIWKLNTWSPDIFTLAAQTHSGKNALQAEFLGGGYAVALSSSPFSVRENQVYRLAGFVRFGGNNLAASLRAVFRSSQEPSREIIRSIAWLTSENTQTDFTRLAGRITCPLGADQVVLAMIAVGGEGRVLFDDLEWVAESTNSPAAISAKKFHEFVFEVDSSLEQIHKLGKTLLRNELVCRDTSGNEFSSAWFAGPTADKFQFILPSQAAKDLPSIPYTFGLAQEAQGFRMQLNELQPPLGYSCEWRFLLPAEDIGKQGVLLVSQEQHSQFTSDFAAAAASIVFGSETNKMRLEFAAPTQVRGQIKEQTLQMAVPVTSSFTTYFQVDFQAQKKQAIDMLHAAEQKEQEGKLGEAIALYQTILRELPFDEKISAQASARYAELLRQGLGRLVQIEKQETEANFFGLREAFFEAKVEAKLVAKIYQGSEVGEKAVALQTRIEKALYALENKLQAEEAKNLAIIAKGLNSVGQEELAKKVQSYLKNYYQPKEQ